MSRIPSDQPQEQENQQAQQTSTLHISNLNDNIHYDTLKHNLYILFTTFGDVLEINIPGNNKLRGQAFIVFTDPKSANIAMRSLQGDEFFGKKLKFDFSHEESKVLQSLQQQV
ncbi:U1 small nuclear ribonucleoprotein [Wickerhamomyces ciferrii]|uniref:U1 small nuclear ribonucleoprotein n=1 Tax=Wickerhamomyces ciferrii (strain ATCC 14091 / BCRC 22168 / CBS 111 / JCM 3599 / NBRC 0793 / NRRL Y-1031 F-60-10) TaxID=1206466 RepID=K0KTE2_WICCF|nr:U1 small nuclear ribonucleoprotein [Wickerhamomyces ciferrii]CCH44563.1 U1 small nuclear ribonucleoprotein [Wickerhamomyces ciferrii]